MADTKEDEAPKPGEKKVYYLKEGRDHSFIKDGVLRTVNEVNDEVELTTEGYEAFKDKFNTDPVKVAAPPKKEEAKEDKKDDGKAPAKSS